LGFLIHIELRCTVNHTSDQQMKFSQSFNFRPSCIRKTAVALQCLGGWVRPCEDLDMAVKRRICFLAENGISFTFLSRRT